MWLLLYSTKCGNIWSTLGYYQMWLLLYSTKCGNIWSTLGYYQMWLLLYSTKCGNIWRYYQMWQHLEYPWIIPNVATSVLHQMWQHLEYPRILPNVATSYCTKCGNIWSTLGYYQMWQHLEYPRIHKDSMFGHYWYFKCCHIWQYIECKKFPLLDISQMLPHLVE